MAGFYEFQNTERESANAALGQNNHSDDNPKKLPMGGKETLAEHKQHCKAEPGNCPFEKAYYDADELSMDKPETSKPILYDRLAMALTQLYALSAEVARAAIDDDSESAKTVADAIEGGIERIREICEKAGCTVEMDDAKSKYIIVPPKSE